MINVAINGAGGKMGRRLVELVSAERDMRLVCAIEPEGSAHIGRDAGELAGIGNIGLKISDSLGTGASVVIDFSSPAGTMAIACACVASRTALVVGTTGLDGKGLSALKKAAKGIACVFSPNMSVGMNVLFGEVGRIASALGDAYDIEIVEAHHKHKKDSPSGSAKRLAERIAASRKVRLEDVAVYGREGLCGPRKKGEIGVFAVRGGDIVGEHRVIYVTDGETIEITHRAHSRDTFARGAVRAARFASRARNGLYTMEQVLTKG